MPYVRVDTHTTCAALHAISACEHVMFEIRTVWRRPKIIHFNVAFAIISFAVLDAS